MVDVKFYLILDTGIQFSIRVAHEAHRSNANLVSGEKLIIYTCSSTNDENVRPSTRAFSN